MARVAKAIHLIERAGSSEKLVCVSPSNDEWETGYWIVKDESARSLIGGKVFIHRGQNLPSHRGGEILQIFHKPGIAMNKRVIRFRSSPDAKGVVTSKEGWGNERKLIWDAMPIATNAIDDTDIESAYPEGAERYRQHRGRERSPALVREAKRLRYERDGRLVCEVCEFDFSLTFSAHGEGYIEAHHTKPISKMDGTQKTKVSDLALVCANCHRMLHRGSHVMSIDELREIRNFDV